MKEANQRLLNEAAEHINKQGRKSGGCGNCYYTLENMGDDGIDLHCALWPLISDYDSQMESGSFSDLLEYSDKLVDWAKDVNPGLADAIQSAHDTTSDHTDTEFLQDFNGAIRDVAVRYGLEVPAVSA